MTYGDGMFESYQPADAYLARIFHEYLIRKHINNLLCNQSVFLLETLFLRKTSP